MPIPLVAHRAYVRAIRSQMLYPLSYGRPVCAGSTLTSSIRFDAALLARWTEHLRASDPTWSGPHRRTEHVEHLIRRRLDLRGNQEPRHGNPFGPSWQLSGIDATAGHEDAGAAVRLREAHLAWCHEPASQPRLCSSGMAVCCQPPQSAASTLRGWDPPSRQRALPDQVTELQEATRPIETHRYH